MSQSITVRALADRFWGLGSCVRSTDFRFTRIWFFTLLANSLFICSCCELLIIYLFVKFLAVQVFYAVWKSRNSPCARGRISMQISLHGDDCDTETQPQRRGWWDYVPKIEPSTPVASHLNAATGGIFRRLHSKVADCADGEVEKNSKVFPVRKPSIAGDMPLAQPPRPPAVAIPDEQPINQRRPSRVDGYCLPPDPSSASRLSKLVPRMELFQKVMKDEACHPSVVVCHILTRQFILPAILYDLYHRDLCRRCRAGRLWRKFQEWA